MTRPTLDYQPLEPDPDLASARLAAMNQLVAPEDLPPTDHPITAFAGQILSPLNYPSPDGSAGPMGPQGGSSGYGGPSTVFAPRSLAGLPAPQFGSSPDIGTGPRGEPFDFAQLLKRGLGVAPASSAPSPEAPNPYVPYGDTFAQIPGHIVSQLGDLASATGSFLAGGKEEAHLIPQPGESKEAYQARRSALTEQSAAAARGVLGAAAAIPATPYTEIVGTINVAQVQGDPIMGPQYRQRIGELAPDQQKDRYAQQAVAHQVIDATTARLLQALDEPKITDDEKRA